MMNHPNKTWQIMIRYLLGTLLVTVAHGCADGVDFTTTDAAAPGLADTFEVTITPESDSPSEIAATLLEPEVTANCVARTCDDVDDTCGTISDLCGGTIECGCRGYLTCGGGGVESRCGCTPVTCESVGADCGEVPDGCGGVLQCGTCSGAATCGGAGPNRCGTSECIPGNPCEDLGVDCGLVPDGCGGVVECGGCAAGLDCSPSGRGSRKCLETAPQCTETGFAAQCPQRSCEFAVGCNEGRCIYEPVSCAPGSCEQTDPNCEALDLDCEWQRCGDGNECPAIFCDSAPFETAGGAMGYANLCVEATGATCGTDLAGDWRCSGSACRRVASDSPTIILLNGAFRATEVRGQWGIRLQNAGFVGGDLQEPTESCATLRGGPTYCVRGGFTGFTRN